MKPVTTLFAWASTIFAGLGTTGATAQPLPLDSLFGIRLGQTVESQLRQCPKNAKGEYDPMFQKNTDKACWVPGQYYKEVRLPQKLWDETRIDFLTPSVNTREGMVVEISVSAWHDHWRKIERYLTRLYGKPHETSTYKTDSRVFGFSSGRTFTWRANGIALYFNSGYADNHARIRMVNLAWEAEDAKEQEERLQRLRSRGLI